MGVHCCCLHVNYIVYKHSNIECTFGLQSLGVCDISYASTRVFEILRETCKRCMLLFTNMLLSCVCCSDGVSTWAKFDGHIYHR